MTSADAVAAVPPRRLLVAVRDDESAGAAVARACAWARPGIDEVHLAHVVPRGVWRLAADLLPAAWTREAATSEPPAWLESLAQAGRALGLSMQVHVLAGQAAQELVAVAETLAADLIIVAGPRDSLAREMFLGSTANKVLRRAGCPVLVCRSHPAAVPRYAKVMLSVDPEYPEMAGKVLQVAQSWLDAPGWHLAYAYRVAEESTLRMRGASDAQIEALRAALAPRHVAELRALGAVLDQPQVHVEHGFASSVLLDMCERLQPDLLVMGKHRGSDWHERVLGSVTQFMLYASRCDMLLVG